MDRDFGLIHVRVRTWFALQILIYLNGHEWLARELAAHGVRYTKHDNAFVWVEDMARAQRFADRFANLNWPAILITGGKMSLSVAGGHVGAAMTSMGQALPLIKIADHHKWEITFRGAAETRKFMEADYARLKQIMTLLGLVK